MSLVKFDKRTIERNLEQGVVNAKEYEKYLSSLPDLEGQYEVIDLSLFEKDEALETAESEKQPQGV